MVCHLVDVAALGHFVPSQAAVTRHHDVGLVSAVVEVVTNVANGNDDTDGRGS